MTEALLKILFDRKQRDARVTARNHQPVHCGCSVRWRLEAPLEVQRTTGTAAASNTAACRYSSRGRCSSRCIVAARDKAAAGAAANGGEQ